MKNRFFISIILAITVLLGCSSSNEEPNSIELVRDSSSLGFLMIEGTKKDGKMVNEFYYYNEESSILRISMFLDNGESDKRDYIVQRFAKNNQLIFMEKYLDDTLNYRKIFDDTLYFYYKQTVIDMDVNPDEFKMSIKRANKAHERLWGDKE